MKDMAAESRSAAVLSAARSALVFLCVLLCTEFLVSAAGAAASVQQQQQVEGVEEVQEVEHQQKSSKSISSSLTSESGSTSGTTTASSALLSSPSPPSSSSSSSPSVSDVGYSTVAHRVDTRSFATCTFTSKVLLVANRVHVDGSERFVFARPFTVRSSLSLSLSLVLVLVSGSRKRGNSVLELVLEDSLPPLNAGDAFQACCSACAYVFPLF